MKINTDLSLTMSRHQAIPIEGHFKKYLTRVPKTIRVTKNKESQKLSQPSRHKATW